jgi:hypothetical protein
LRYEVLCGKIVLNVFIGSSLIVKFFLQEHNFAAVGLDNWHQACYIPTSSDGMVIAFRNWFRRYCKNQIVWPTPQVEQLPSILTKDKLLDR